MLSSEINNPASATTMDTTDTGMNIPCCPTLIKDDHCDVIYFSRVLMFPTTVTAPNRQQPATVEVILRFKFSRCTLGLTLGDPAYSTTLLPGEKVRLATTDRRSRFTYDSETKLSYRSEQVSEEQYYMTAVQKYMADAAAAQSGQASESSSSHWDFQGDANGSINPFSLSADASTSASGNHNSQSVADYLNQQKSHVQSSAAQAISATRKAHSVSVGEVSTRTHTEGESEDHFEASSREFSNPNKCHAVTFIFYRLNKKQVIRFELTAIEKRVLDANAPIGGILQPGTQRIPISLIPQDIPATTLLKRTALVNATTATAGTAEAFTFSYTAPYTQSRTQPFAEQNFGAPIDAATRHRALQEVEDQLKREGLLDDNGQVAPGKQEEINFETEFSLPTAGIIVKGCLDDCNICEPMAMERMQLENDLLRKQIELLEKSQEYRCCPQETV